VDGQRVIAEEIYSFFGQRFLSVCVLAGIYDADIAVQSPAQEILGGGFEKCAVWTSVSLKLRIDGWIFWGKLVFCRCSGDVPKTMKMLKSSKRNSQHYDQNNRNQSCFDFGNQRDPDFIYNPIANETFACPVSTTLFFGLRPSADWAI